MFSSLDPTRLLNIRPRSKRSSGRFHRLDDRLGTQALAAPLHTEQQHAAGRWQAEFLRPVGKRQRSFLQPLFETVQAGDIIKPVRRVVVFEQPVLADDLPLLAEHDAHVLGVQLAIGHQCLGKHILRFLQRQTPGPRAADSLASAGSG